MLARVLAVALCLSGCYKSMFCRNGWTDRAGFFGLQASFGLYPTLCCKEIQVSTKIMVPGTSLWNFVQNSGLRKFCFGVSIVETCYQLSWRKADAASVINWTVVGQLSR